MALVNGCVANCTLNKSGVQSGEAIMIAIGVGFSVMIPCFLFGAASEAHLSPALALCVDGSRDWINLPGYAIAFIPSGAIPTVHRTPEEEGKTS